jgi:Mu transposase, C-terminal domain
MVTDKQILRLRQALRQGMSLSLAALKAGLDRKTARKYRCLDRLPSEVSMAHTWRTRADPFADVWPQLQEQLLLNPGLEAKTLFGALQRQHPGRFSDGQLRTLQRRVKQWRATQGPAKEVFFAQVHHPGRLCASDFTHLGGLGVTIQGAPLDHLVYHFVLTYSNWESVTLCFSESFESFSTGFQNAVWQLGGVPPEHRSDRMSLAVNQSADAELFTQRYRALLAHYGMAGQTIQARQAHENGDAEQSHHRFKRALEQALLLRGSRDFEGRPAYERFLGQLCQQANAGRALRLAEERPLLRPLPARRLETLKRLRVKVTAGSTIRVERNTYSVPARLIGEWVEARVGAEQVEVWYAGGVVERLPRLRGRHKHQIAYRHVIDWLVRKPGAFAGYKYQADLFPTSRFRMAYDGWLAHKPQRASREYLALLHLAAKQGEAEVDRVLAELLTGPLPVGAQDVQARLGQGNPGSHVPAVRVEAVDLTAYDDLLEHKEVDDEPSGRSEVTPGGAAQGAAPAHDAQCLRGGRPGGPAGGVELRAVPAEPCGA